MSLSDHNCVTIEAETTQGTEKRATAREETWKMKCAVRNEKDNVQTVVYFLKSARRCASELPRRHLQLVEDNSEAGKKYPLITAEKGTSGRQ